MRAQGKGKGKGRRARTALRRTIRHEIIINILYIISIASSEGAGRHGWDGKVRERADGVDAKVVRHGRTRQSTMTDKADKGDKAHMRSL